MRTLRIIGVLCCLIAPGLLQAQASKGEARIGVLAYRGSDQVQQKWMPLRDYLSAAVPDWSFQLVPVTLSSAEEQIKSGQLDFLITNPGHFAVLNVEHRMSVLASRSQRKSNGQLSNEFGSAIIAHRESGITTLDDVAGQSVAAVGRNAFGGFQVAWYALDRAGVDLFSDPSSLTFVGFPMDQVVDLVMTRSVDVGIVRSGLMEELIAEGRVSSAEFTILNANVTYDHPDAVSTSLYPEWPFAALVTADLELKNQVALALLQTSISPLAETYGMTDLWSAPLPYHSVLEVTEAYQARLEQLAQSSTDVALFARWLVLIVLGAVAAVIWWTRQKTGVPASAVETHDAPHADDVSLTQREREILDFIAEGYSTKEIALDLGISPKTVEFHRSNLLRKFGARTSSQLVAMAT